MTSKYNEALRILRKYLPTEFTTSSQLYFTGDLLWGKFYTGTFARDSRPDWNTKKRGYMIVNTDKGNQSGTHWVALCYDGVNPVLIYDSFGRNTKDLLKKDTPVVYVEADRDPEQSEKQTDCGLRCLAFIWVFHHYGFRKAQSI